MTETCVPLVTKPPPVTVTIVVTFELTDERRLERARATGPDQLHASLDRLAGVAEQQPAS